MEALQEAILPVNNFFRVMASNSPTPKFRVNDAAFAAEIGHVVGPVKTQFGYHLIKVEKKNEATVASLEEVKETIRRTLLQQKQNEAYNTKVEEMKKKYVK